MITIILHMKKETKEQMNKICYPCNLFLKGFKYDRRYRKDQEKSKSQLEETIAERVKLRRRRRKADDEDLCDMPPLEVGEEEVKGKTGLKTLSPKKLSTRLPNY